MIKILREAKVLDLPGFEPGAFRMQSERDTTTLQTLGACLSHLPLFELSLIDKSAALVPEPSFRHREGEMVLIVKNDSQVLLIGEMSIADYFSINFIHHSV